MDVKDLHTLQQFVLYIFPIITNLGFINVLVVVVRLRYFEKRIQSVQREQHSSATRGRPSWLQSIGSGRTAQRTRPADSPNSGISLAEVNNQESSTSTTLNDRKQADAKSDPVDAPDELGVGRIVWAEDVHDPSGSSQRDEQQSPIANDSRASSSILHRRSSVISTSSQRRYLACESLPQLSRQATLGRNSSFGNLTKKDKEVLGGLEYRSLRLLLKIVIGRQSLASSL